MLQWIFDKAPASGASTGGSPLLHTLGSDINLNTFIREVVQNSYDQIKPQSQGQIKFTFTRLHDSDKAEFLAGLGWEELEPHIRGENPSGVMSTRLKQALEQIESGPITILRIDDSGTLGLTGDEDDQGSNFKSLCKDILVTSDNNHSNIGSYGLGKTVLWRFSSISTVLFSSRIQDNNSKREFRLFGRSELPSHQTSDGILWSGPGWYGIPETVGEGLRAISAWDKDAEISAETNRMLRTPDSGTGTTIMIVGFFEPTADEPRELKEVCSDILEIATRWFWPALRRDEIKIQITAYEHNQVIFDQVAHASGAIQPFVTAITDKNPLAMVKLLPKLFELIFRDQSLFS